MAAAAGGYRLPGGPERGGPERKAKAAEIAARRIAELVFSQGLPEGAALPNEREMAEEFGIGRATLREALRLLETQGVLRIRPGPGGGPVVRRPSSADLTGPLTLLLQSLGSTLEEALVAWEALEPTAAALAARHATHAQLAELDRCLARMEAALDGPAFYDENLAFHRLLGEMAANTVLLVVLEAIKQVTATIGRSIEVPRGVRADLVQTCRELRTALHTGDSAQATTVASAMLARWRALIVEQYPLALRAPVRWSADGA